MRFVPTRCLREGMIVGKTIYGKNVERMLIRGAVINEQLINGIVRLKYSGIYIDDDISKDIEIVSIINDSLRMEATRGIKKVFIKSTDSKGKPFKIDNIHDQVESIIDELLKNRNMMVNMIDLKCFDNYTYAHSVNVAVLSLMVGISLGLNRSTLSILGLGAIMHDIGKVFIDKDILNKPGKLTDDEFGEIKKHTTAGYEYIKKQFNLPLSIHDAIIDHHEKYDGSGYPNEKKGDTISLFGRIISIADVYDALSSERPYRKALPPSEAMEFIMGNSGSVFDSEIVKYFVRKVAPYPVGSTVKLSNGYIGLILENFESCCLRPRVRVIKDGDNHVKPYEINLKDDFGFLNVVIEGIDQE